MDPKQIYFSLPTLESVAPPTSEASGALLVLHEDDWRQIEVVAAALRTAVDGELAEIRKVHDERVAHGVFKRLHVRAGVPEPLAGCEVTLDEVMALGKRSHDGVAFRDAPARGVPGSFALVAGGVQLYGVAHEGRVTALCLDEPRPSVVAALRQRHELLVVDWCRAHVE